MAESTLLRRLSALAEWVGAEGRRVDRRGELLRKEIASAATAVGEPSLRAKHLGDVLPLAALWDLALELDVLALHRTHVIAGETLPAVKAALRGDGPPEQALELWDEVYDELVHPGAAAVKPEQQLLRDWAQPWMPHLLGNLYTQYPDGEFADVDPLVSDVIAERSASIPAHDSQTFTALATTLLLRGLYGLAEHGTVDVDIPLRSRELADAQVVGMRVRLTDLGRRSVHKHLAADRAAVSPAAHSVSA